MKNILVTGATGNIGRALLDLLRAEDVNVRAMMRHPETANLPPEIETVYGDFTDPASLDAALEGIDSIFLLWIAPPATLDDAIARIARQVRHIVFLSNFTVRDDADDQVYVVTALHEQIERKIQATRVPWTFLRPGAFATNARLFWAPQVRRGNVVRWPYRDAAMSPIHERDIAAVAARALCEDGHTGAKYLITGPHSMTQGEQVQILGDALGRPLQYEEIPPETALQEMSAILPPAIAAMLLKAFAAAVGTTAPLTNTVAEVTGSAARTFYNWCRDHAAEFR